MVLNWWYLIGKFCGEKLSISFAITTKMIQFKRLSAPILLYWCQLYSIQQPCNMISYWCYTPTFDPRNFLRLDLGRGSTVWATILFGLKAGQNDLTCLLYRDEKSHTCVIWLDKSWALIRQLMLFHGITPVTMLFIHLDRGTITGERSLQTPPVFINFFPRELRPRLANVCRTFHDFAENWRTVRRKCLKLGLTRAEVRVRVKGRVNPNLTLTLIFCELFASSRRHCTNSASVRQCSPTDC
jgi:hypothetical protein